MTLRHLYGECYDDLSSAPTLAINQGVKRTKAKVFTTNKLISYMKHEKQTFIEIGKFYKVIINCGRLIFLNSKKNSFIDNI